MRSFKPNTAGEILFSHIYQELSDHNCWNTVAHVLRATGEGDKYVKYILQHSALYTCCKLISAAKGVAGPGPIENSAAIASLINNGPWRTLDNGGRLLRFLVAATENSDSEIPNGISNTLEKHSKEKHDWCYICGIKLNYDNSESRAFFTLDHIWPKSYGGESTESNLLPACRDCNEKKANAALWVASDIHAAFLGLNPTRDKLAKLKSERRIALYQRAGVNLAIERSQPLKKAFLSLGPWDAVSIYDSDLVAEMFNMRIHNEAKLDYEEDI